MVSSRRKPIVLTPGMRLYISFHQLRTNPRLWGDDVGQFVPERFLDENRQTKEYFMPFGFGERMCVGFKFAELAAKLSNPFAAKLRRNDGEFWADTRFTDFLDVKLFPFTIQKRSSLGLNLDCLRPF
jgi:cytochrome P450